MLIRENKYNDKNSAYGWIFDSNKEPMNIHVTDELLLTKEPSEIFDIIMRELTVQKHKINLTPKTIPAQVFKLLDIDVSKYISEK